MDVYDSLLSAEIHLGAGRGSSDRLCVRACARLYYL